MADRCSNEIRRSTVSDLPIARQAEPITDSPWLWFAVFASVGLAALVATGGKFGRRQAGIENKYQARAAVARGQVVVDESEGGRKAAVGAPEYTTPGRTAIPLWPVQTLLGLVAVGSFAMLLRQRLGRRSADSCGVE